MKRKIKSVTAVAATLVLLMVIGADAQIKPDVPPVKGKMTITSKYGPAIDPIAGKKRHHSGIDIRADIGTPIYATADGTIKEAGLEGAYGNKIVISHEDNFETLYAHLSSIIIQPGERVKKGELIGYSGNTGRSTGPHLHYEILENGKRVNPEHIIDPADD